MDFDSLKLATFQVLSSHVQLGVAILESVDIENFHHHRKFC